MENEALMYLLIGGAIGYFLTRQPDGQPPLLSQATGQQDLPQKTASETGVSGKGWLHQGQDSGYYYDKKSMQDFYRNHPAV